MWLFCELEEQIDALPHSRKATHPISLHIITSTIYHSIFNHRCPQSSENRSLSLCLYKYPVQKLANDCKYRLTVDWEVVSPKSATIWADAQALQFCAILASKCLRILLSRSFLNDGNWGFQNRVGSSCSWFFTWVYHDWIKVSWAVCFYQGSGLDYTVSCLRQASHGMSKSMSMLLLCCMLASHCISLHQSLYSLL